MIKKTIPMEVENICLFDSLLQAVGNVYAAAHGIGNMRSPPFVAHFCFIDYLVNSFYQTRRRSIYTANTEVKDASRMHVVICEDEKTFECSKQSHTLLTNKD